MTKKGWRGTPMTVGLAIVMVLGAGAVGVWALRGQQEIEATCNRAVNGHKKADIDLAHVTLPKRYVTRGELVDKVHRIDKRLDRLEQGQQQAQQGQRQILRELRRRRRR